ncbi:MAG TPA: TadE/TadG family type IV pilus assembly protein [Granulicella sp.]
MQRLARFAQEEHGSELVEFAMSSLIFFLMLLGLFEFCLALYADHFVSYAASEGARYAVVRGSSWASSCGASYATYSCTAAGSNVSDYVKSITPGGITVSHLTVNTTYQAGPSGGGCTGPDLGCMVQVTVSYPFDFLLPLVSVSAFTLQSSSAMTVSQ